MAGGFPTSLHLALERGMVLRYGENPHQRAARYRTLGDPPGWWDGAALYGGRELSYLNLLDAEAAWSLVHELAGPHGLRFAADLAAAVIVKHTNPCGVAVSDDLGTAHARALESDPVSAFGGILALSGPVTEALAEQIVDGPLADVLVAPAIDDGALACFAAKRRNIRVIAAPPPCRPQLDIRQVDGGFLVQEPDRIGSPPADWRVATKLAPTDEQWRDLELAWRVCARTSSNAVVWPTVGRWSESDVGSRAGWTRRRRRPQGRRTSAGGSGGE